MVRSSCSSRARFPAGWRPPFFFLRRQRFLYGPQAADLLIHIQERAAQILKLPELGDLPFRFAHRDWCRQSFADGLALNLVGKA